MFHRTAIGLSALLLICTAMPLSAQNMTKTELQNMYVSYLIEKGYSPGIDEDGDVWFKHNIKTIELTYYIIIYENDQTFFQILLPSAWSLETKEEKRQGPIAASSATYSNWVVKVYTNSAGDNISFSGEMLLAKPENFRDVFDDMMSFMEATVIDFANKMP